MEKILVIAALIILPILFILAMTVAKPAKKRRKKKNQLLDLYRQIIADNHLQINGEEILTNKIFALDTQKKLFILIYNHGAPAYDIIQLKALSGCYIKKAAGKNDGPPAGIRINEVYLNFMSGDLLFASLPVYTEQYDGMSGYYLLSKTAENWQEKINMIIKS